jgi:hypothetical protein
MVEVICRKFSKLFTFSFSLFTFLFLSYSLSGGAQITGPEVKLQDHEIYVSTSLTLDDKYLQELEHGVTKEFRFYIDLFRIWNMWPDEFVLSKSFIRTLESDPVKMEHLATTNDGNTLIQKRFRSFKSMIQWALSISDLRLANMRELEPGAYFVRVTVESKIRKLPPVIGYFMIFLPENDFKIKKDSPLISVGKAR